MSALDDAYVRSHFVGISGSGGVTTDQVVQHMLDGALPLPSYLLSDGTPMVPADLLAPLAWTGGVDGLYDWFVSWWEDDPATGDIEWGAYLSGQYVCLRVVSPDTIRQKTRMIDQAKVALQVLEEDRHDPVGRGLLGEAITQLERLYLPMCDYDRLRFGGRLTREVWVDDVRHDFLTPAPPPLPLRTERLVLRHVRNDDLEALHSWYSDPDVARFTLFSAQTRAENEARIRHRIPKPDDDWHTMALLIEMDGAAVGDIYLDLMRPSLSQAEVGWLVSPAAQGRGIATEAARAAIGIAFDHYRVHRVVALLDARNPRSAAVCERLGMRRESHKIRDYWSKGEWTDSLEYAVLADEWRAH